MGPTDPDVASPDAGVGEVTESAARVEVHDRPDERRFVIIVDGAIAGFATYRLRDAVITFLHTEVDPAFGGRGLGARLATYALDDARRRGLRVIPICPFIARFIGAHPAYQDLLRP